MERLIIRMFNDANAQWALYKDGILQVSQNTVAALSSLERLPPPDQEQRTIIVLAPGEDILLSSIEVPVKQQRQLSQILAYLAEDQLAEDVTGLHIVSGLRQGNGKTPIAVVRKSLISQWLGQLKDAGVTADILVPVTLAVPYSPQSWTILCEQQSVWLRSGLFEGITLYFGNVAAALELLSLHEESASVTLRCIVDTDDTYHAIQDRLAQRWNMQVQMIEHSAFAMLCEECLLENASFELNLMQGEFASPVSSTAQSKKAKRLVAFIAFWLILWVVLNGMEALYFTWQADRMSGQTVAIYHQFFPEDKKIIDPVQQMKTHLSAIGGVTDDGFFVLLRHISSHWPGILNAGQLKIESLRYQNESHQLTVTISAGTLATLNTLAQTLNTPEASVKLLSAVQQKDEVTGSLSIQEKRR